MYYKLDEYTEAFCIQNRFKFSLHVLVSVILKVKPHNLFMHFFKNFLQTQPEKSCDLQDSTSELDIS